MVKRGPNKFPTVAEKLDKYFRQDGTCGLSPLAASLLLLLVSQADFPPLLQSSSSKSPVFLHGSVTRLNSISDADAPGESDPPASEPTLAQIISAIQDCKATLTAQMETIHIDFSLLKQDVQHLRDSTGAAGR